MKRFFIYLWQLPQHLLALLLIHVVFRKRCKKVTLRFGDRDIDVWCVSKWKNGVSLGNYILLDLAAYRREVVKHEYGHSIQSLYFGWLYLPVIGLSSGIMNIISRLNPSSTFAKNYYNRWPENWANKLASVNVSFLN